MKKFTGGLLLFNLLIMMVSSSYAISSECNPAIADYSANATIRDNEVSFKVNGSGVDHVFVINDERCEYSITSGQPWGGVYPNINNSSANIKAGRKNSTTNVEWVKNQMIKSSNVQWLAKNATTAYSHDALPGELNFAIKTTLQLVLVDLITRYDCDNVIIAQGHNSSSRNNWWMFANTENTLPAPYNRIQLKCRNETTGSMATVNFAGSNVSEFSLEFNRP